MTEKTQTGFHSVTLKYSYPIKPLEDVVCPLCDANDDFVLATKGFPNNIAVRNVICKGCGLVRINPRMSQKNYELFYKEDFFGYLNPYARSGYVAEIEHTRDEGYETPTKKKNLPYVLPYVKQSGHVLDIGAGFGQMLYLLKKEKGVTCIGLEPDPYSRAVAKEKIGVELTDMTIEEFANINTEMFDFMYMDQTFEHLLSPLQALQSLAHFLKPEGVMYIGVPGTYNPVIHMSLFYQIAHTYNYTPHTMRLFAEKAGLKIIHVREPRGYPLEVLLAHKDSSYPEESLDRMKPGSWWIDVVYRLHRQRCINTVRGFSKKILLAIGGTRLHTFVKSLFD